MNCFTFLESNKEKIKKGGFYQILCRKCGATICGSRYSMKRHLLTSKHRRGFGPNGQTASELIIQDSVDRVTQTFLQASVPIDKFHRLVNRDSIVAFRSLGSIPSIRTVRRSIVRVLEEKKSNMKRVLVGQRFCLMMDETTDITSRSLCAVVVTNLDFRLCLKVKEMDRCDASSLQKLLEETLLEYEIDWQQITNFVTDGARACVSLGRRLNEQYAIQHTLCAAHLLHLISQKLMESFPNINGLCKLMEFKNDNSEKDTLNRWRNIETWLFKMSGKDYAKIINLSVNSGTMGKIMDFLNKIRRYKPRWEDANRIIYTHFLLMP
ncbi:hypothetical protein M0812_11275 [Anaeramoeba flamelloides]|uniref:DUF659 domain-containing protein n=1 Tax=Anaeramoeba flamelloides TaxID=1746091 RepID=A0AAV7ZXR1_9EUKA|nr:hypothetical protein M0812_11275 [Anaeramoeba flamelloides]